MPLYLNLKNIVLEKGLLAKYNHYFDVFQTKAQLNFVMKIIKKVYYLPLCLPSFYLSLSIYIYIYIYTRVYIYTYVCICIYMCVCMCVCVCVCVCVCIYIYIFVFQYHYLPGGASGKEPACQCRRHKRQGFDPWVRKILWRRKWQSIPVFLPGEFHGQRSLAGYIQSMRLQRVGHN